ASCGEVSRHPKFLTLPRRSTAGHTAVADRGITKKLRARQPNEHRRPPIKLDYRSRACCLLFPSASCINSRKSSSSAGKCVSTHLSATSRSECLSTFL